jgi:BirA family biotin operon repressor/biotin-[acetyl-CoA-carboxylase] ligase
LALSLAIEDFVPALAGLVWVKWPNDVMIGLKKGETAALKARKTAGILSEGDEHTLFIGIGVNVAQTGFPQEYRSKATSIALALSALNRSPAGGDRSAPERIFSAEDRFPLLEKILLRLFEEFSPPENPGLSESWRGRLEERLYLKGLPVSFVPRSAAEAGGRAPDKDGPCQTVEGRLEGIGPGGELLILPKDALRPLSFVSGELQVYT